MKTYSWINIKIILGHWKVYVKLTGQYRKPSDITPVPSDIQRYFVTRGVASSDKIPLNIGDINRYFVPRGTASRDKIPREDGPLGMCAIFHEGCFPSSILVGTGVILRGFLYWPVHFTCICRIDQELFTLKKPKLNPRKITGDRFDTF